MARYAGQPLAPAEGFGLRPWLLLTFGQKGLIMLFFFAHLGQFWCSVVTYVTFRSNINNTEEKSFNYTKNNKSIKEKKNNKKLSAVKK